MIDRISKKGKISVESNEGPRESLTARQRSGEMKGFAERNGESFGKLPCKHECREQVDRNPSCDALAAPRKVRRL